MKVLAQEIAERFLAYQGDCVEVTRAMPDSCVHYSVFSPPFDSLYTYSASDRDMGNTKNKDDFANHFRFLVPELFRITKPGRLLSFHCMNLPTSKARDGYIGIRDFRGELIAAFLAAGWIYHSEVVIWKDPVTAMQRTKALGLLHKQLKKDSCMSRQGIPDYLVTMIKPGFDLDDVYPGHLVTMRKPGDNPEPVSHTNETFPVKVWQRYASPVWMDINPSNTLQHRSAREDKDERHICLARGSLVLTRDGYRPIEGLSVGEDVLTHKGRWRPISAVACTGVRPVVRVKAHGVADLRLTPDHKIWTRPFSGTDKWHHRETAMKSEPVWMSASETIGHYVNLKLPPIETTHLSDLEWWIVGRWLGDGHTNMRVGRTRGSPLISSSYEETDELVSKLGRYAGKVYDTGTSNQVYIRGNGGKGGHHNHPLHEMIIRCGRGASNKRVPAEALALNPDTANVLLEGYLSADGHLDSMGRWHFVSVSRALALGIAMVAQRARQNVASVFAGRPAGTASIQGRTVNTRAEWKGMISPRNRSAFVAADGAWKKVRSVEIAGESEVWDIKVTDDQSFTAEGCIVHNCPLQLEVIQRAVELWTNPNDIVFSPFAGIGSEGYQSLKMGRRFAGVELKKSYYDQAVKNLHAACVPEQQTLFGDPVNQWIGEIINQEAEVMEDDPE